jgi:glutathione S-transferase
MERREAPGNTGVQCMASSGQHRPLTPQEDGGMITLYSYPELFGVADNNPYGLKIFAFLKLCKLAFRHEHVFDAKAAPRGQLPYIVDDGEHVGDSDAIISHLIRKHGLAIDNGLTRPQQITRHLIRRMLDDLYWVMSYSRWHDPRFWPRFRDEILRTHPGVSESSLEQARKYNFDRYYYQGIGRYEPDAVFERGISDLQVLADLMLENGFLFGTEPTSADAGIYGFIANIYFYDIDTPLKRFVASHANLVRHCRSLHAAVSEEDTLRISAD